MRPLFACTTRRCPWLGTVSKSAQSQWSQTQLSRYELLSRLNRNCCESLALEDLSREDSCRGSIRCLARIELSECTNEATRIVDALEGEADGAEGRALLVFCAKRLLRADATRNATTTFPSQYTSSAETADKIVSLLLLMRTDAILSASDASLLSSSATLLQMALNQCAFARADGNGDQRVPSYAAIASACVMSSGSAEDATRITRLLQRGSDYGSLSVHALVSLLTLPVQPEILGVVVQYVLNLYGCRSQYEHRMRSPSLSERYPSVDCSVACVAWNALLNSDSFFSNHATFVKMDKIMHDILDHVSVDTDVHAVMWTPLLNKLSRVYQKQQQGWRLFEFHSELLRRFPQIEVKLPAPYLIRCIGSLIDYDRDTIHVDSNGVSVWSAIAVLGRQGASLYCGKSSTAHARDLWSVVLKAALTLRPLEEDYVRLLDAYAVFAEWNYEVDVDKAAFHQVTRLVGTALASHGIRSNPQNGSIDRVAESDTLEESVLRIIDRFCEFLGSHKSISFLWIIDATAVMLQSIWEGAGPNGAAAAERLITVLEEKIFPSRHVTGVHIRENYLIREVLEKLSLAELSPFWWVCGCGTKNPACSRMCGNCMRRSRVSWCCPKCGEEHHSHPDTADSRKGPSPAAFSELTMCACGEKHPRVAAAHAAGVSLCAICWSTATESLVEAEQPDLEVSSKQQQDQKTVVCTSCRARRLAGDNAQVAVQQERSKRCTHCNSLLREREKYCSNCFEPWEENGQHLSMWCCEVCHQYTYSTWSVCQRCPRGASPRPKKLDSVSIPFVPWICGCGARNHPGTLSCRRCKILNAEQGSQRSAPITYRCTDCQQKNTKVTTYTVTDAVGVELHVALCPNCSAVHPRDEVALDASSILRPCISCGHPIPSSHAGIRESTQPAICSSCNSPQPSANPLRPFSCQTCCQGGTTLQTGYACSACGVLRKDVRAETAHVWRCLREVEDVHSNGSDLCGVWNPSWESSCSGCGRARMRACWESLARYHPWTCRDCGSHNKATDVLFCPHCDKGIQPAPHCHRCEKRHLSLRCPSASDFISAKRHRSHCIGEP